MFASTRAWLMLVVTLMLAGCQFANSPASVAPTVGRSASAANSATPTRPATAASASPTRPSGPTPGRTPTSPAGGAPTTVAAATSTPRAPTLGRVDTPSPTLGRGGSVGAILPPGQERLTGDVTAFAASARVLQVRTEGGRERQVSLAPSAAIKRADGSAGTPADLRPGQRVQATGRGNGDADLIADEIVLLAPR